MTTMKEFVGMYDKTMSTEEALGRGGELLDIYDQMGEYLNCVSEKAQAVILERMEEKEFVKALNGAVSALVFAMTTQRGDIAPLRFLLSESMQPFVHTIVLCAIGMLVDEEVL